GLEGDCSITGWLQDPLPLVAQASVVVSTSTSESFGFAVAEALALGRPVVASAITGSVDIMRGDLSRWLYPPGDISTAARLVELLLNDEALARSIGELGQAEIAESVSSAAMRRAATLVSTAA